MAEEGHLPSSPPAISAARPRTPPSASIGGRSQPTPPSNPPSLFRRQSSRGRIDEILETALGRAETMSGNLSPRMQPLLRPESAPTIPDNDGSADEATGIFARTKSSSRGGGPAPGVMNYQSTNETATTRNRRTASNRATTNGEEHEGHGDNADEDRRREKNKWWSKTLANFRSVELENKGSVARDHLALERTFLAWLRTSLTFASIGIAITQLFRLNTSLADNKQNTLRHLGKPLGAVFLGISILVLFLGYKRYIQSQHWIIKGKFPASRGTVMLVSLVALLLMVVSLVVVIVAQPVGTGT